MRVARLFLPDSSSVYAQLIGDEAHVLDVAPWLGGTPTGAVRPLKGSRLLAPVEPTKVVGAGRNYRDHVAEMGYDLPVRPTIFLKPPTTLVDPGGNVVLPPKDVSSEVEHEAELVVVVGSRATRVPESDARRHIFGYTIANDVSARDLQRSDPTLARGKGWDTFCPIGPWIETDIEPDALAIRCAVNGITKQDGTTADLIFGVDALVSFVSQFMTLLPGDILLTGSPGGSDRMHSGDHVEIEIEGIGVLSHSVQASPV